MCGLCRHVLNRLTPMSVAVLTGKEATNHKVLAHLYYHPTKIHHCEPKSWRSETTISKRQWHGCWRMLYHSHSTDEFICAWSASRIYEISPHNHLLQSYGSSCMSQYWVNENVWWRRRRNSFVELQACSFFNTCLVSMCVIQTACSLVCSNILRQMILW